jgi:hypothetical protein
MRIEIGNRYNRIEFIKWMIKHFGEPEEDKTWFWSNRGYKEINQYGQEVDKHQEGVEIWADKPGQILLTQLRWSV